MTTAVRVQAVSRMRVEDILQKHSELIERITLALNPDFYTDAGTLQALQTELNAFKERTEREEIQGLLERYDEAVRVRVGLSVAVEQLHARRAEVDPEYEFPSTLLASTLPALQTAPAGPSSTDRAQGSGRVLSAAERSVSPDGGLERASGPQRGPTLIRGARNESNAPPSSLRPVPSLPSDCLETFDVVFLPCKSDRSMQLPDLALNAAQLCLRDLGLIFEVKVPRQGVMKSDFDRQVRHFCQDKNITLKSSRTITELPVWTLMVFKKRSKKGDLQAELLTPAEFTTEKLKSHKVRNYLSEDNTKQVLLIAPLHADLEGAINFPHIDTPQMKHRCLVSRLDAALQYRVGGCNNRCAEPDTGNTSRRGAGRTLV
ncbi:hypothetical protein C8R45DRAFT_78238 [Mycena sanguinolenta]|nr:hypothetical protein C8R45DRAFT_78238 [Mycena sanguinolenta]